MRKFVMALCAFFVIAAAGCNQSQGKQSTQLILNTTGQNQQQEANPDQSKKTVALVMKTLTNPFYIDMEKGARKAAKELDINLLVRTGAQETSIEQQINIVEELIQSKVDAIVISPGHSKDLIPVLKKAQDAQIPVINIDNRLDPVVSQKMGLIGVPFISVDNEYGAYMSAKYVADQIHTDTEVAVLEGIRGAINGELRKKGALKAFAENKHIKIAATETANWKIDEAYSVTAKIFQKHPNIGAVFCANDMMALGAIEYLTKEKKTGVMIAGFDALAEANRAILAGKMAVTINQQANIQGYIGVCDAVKMINGEKLPLETYVPFIVVDVNSLK